MEDEPIAGSSKGSGSTPITGHVCNCGSSFQTFENLKQHVFVKHPLDLETIRSLLTCPCGLVLETNKDYMEHLATHREIKDLKCSKCEKTFETTLKLCTHLRQVHRNDVDYLRTVFKCNMADCPKPFDATSALELRAHFKLHHLKDFNDAVQCPHCEQILSKKSALKVHIAAKHQNKKSKYTCSSSGCEEGFSAWVPYERHMEQEHPTERLEELTCKSCGKYFYRFNNLWNHMYRSQKCKRKDEPSLPAGHSICSICNETVEDLMTHFQENHDGLKQDKSMCIRCGKHYEHWISLRKHLAKAHPYDSEVQKWYFSCEIEGCQEFRSSSSKLANHVKMDHAAFTSNATECSKCLIKFVSKAAMLLHYQLKHGNIDGQVLQTLKCSKCNYIAENLSTLRHHASSHSQDLIDCKGCKKKIRNSEIASHVRQCHSKEPEVLKLYFSCPSKPCSKWFKSFTALRIHRLTHFRGFSRATHSCSICQNNFTRKRSKINHVMNVHAAKLKLFKCSKPKCSKEFRSSASLMKHTEKMHMLVNRNQKVICLVCNRMFCDKIGLRRHVKLLHRSDIEATESLLKCRFPSCRKTAENKFEMAMHMRSEHAWIKTIESTCHLCSKTLSSLGTVMNHASKLHPEVEDFERAMLTCSIDGCLETRKNMMDLRNHRMQHTAPHFEPTAAGIKGKRMKQMFTCTHSDCKTDFKSKGELRFHLYQHDVIKSFRQCTKCFKYFKKTGVYNLHTKRCTGIKFTRQIRTENCDRPSCHVSPCIAPLMHSHMMDHFFKGDGFQCRLCGSFLSTRASLKKHVHNFHNINFSKSGNRASGGQHNLEVVGAFEVSREATEGKMRFSCRMCFKKFGERKCLLEHVKRTHHQGRKSSLRLQTEAEGEIKCSNCNQLFPCQFAYMKHVNKEHESDKATLTDSLDNQELIGTRNWCNCCKFDPPLTGFELDDAFNVWYTPPEISSPSIMSCVACDFTTTDQLAAFLHIQNNLSTDIWKNFPPKDESIITPSSYYNCRKCQKIFLSSCEYMWHLQVKHYPDFIAFKLMLYPQSKKSMDVRNFIKYAGTPGFALTDPCLAQKIREAWIAAGCPK